MGLRSFHLFFIFLASLVLLGFGAWCLEYYGGLKQGIYLWVGGGSVALGIATGVYGIWFYCKTKKLGLVE
jgi:hypothetical protein